jgi:hypothetical protein
MEDGDESAAAAAAEAALGLSPQVFVDEVLDIIADVSAEAFEYCLQLRSLRIPLSRIPASISIFVSVFSLTLRHRPASLFNMPFSRCFSSPGKQPHRGSSVLPRRTRRLRSSSG